MKMYTGAKWVITAKQQGLNRTFKCVVVIVDDVVSIYGPSDQRLGLNLPKSASFLDLLAQNDAALER